MSNFRENGSEPQSPRAKRKNWHYGGCLPESLSAKGIPHTKQKLSHRLRLTKLLCPQPAIGGNSCVFIFLGHIVTLLSWFYSDNRPIRPLPGVSSTLARMESAPCQTNIT